MYTYTYTPYIGFVRGITVSYRGSPSPRVPPKANPTSLQAPPRGLGFRSMSFAIFLSII